MLFFLALLPLIAAFSPPMVTRMPRSATLLADRRAPSPVASDENLKIIICGAPASGKGTQCELIKEKYNVVHLSTGDMLREAVKDGTEVGTQAKGFMERGELVPDEVIIGIVKDRLDESDCKECGWLLDGFPRTEAQANALSEAGIVPNKVLYLQVPDEMLIERVVGRRLDPETGKIYHMTFSPPENDEVAARLTQRSDDTAEKAVVRLEQFHKNMEAVEACYKTSPGIEYTDGTRSKAAVFEDLQKALD